MDKINFKTFDNLLRELPLDITTLIYNYYDNFCQYCDDEMVICMGCKDFFCMIRRCNNCLCICEKFNRSRFFPFGASDLICPNSMVKQREHYNNCFYQTFYCYSSKLFCYKCYFKKIN